MTVAKPSPARRARTAPPTIVAMQPQPRPLRLIIQIPCYNEEASLPETLAALPRALHVDRLRAAT